MKPGQFLTLAAASAVSLGLAVATYFAAVPWSPDNKKQASPLLPALQAKKSEPAALEIVSGKETLKLAAEGGAWVLATGEGYPADTAKVRELLLNAAEARLVERKTAMKERHALLGTADPSEPNATSRILRVLDKDGGGLGEIILGRTAFDAFEASKGGTYVRRPGEDQVWLADRPLSAGLSLRDWVKTRLIDLSPASIMSVRIEVEGEPGYDISRTEDGKAHQLASMPAGKKLRYVDAVDAIVEAVSLIEFRKVRKAGPADALPVKGRATLESETGYRPVIEYRSDGKEAWVRIIATGPEPAKADVEDITRGAANWEFEVPLTELNAGLVKFQDLLEDVPS